MSWNEMAHKCLEPYGGAKDASLFTMFHEVFLWILKVPVNFLPICQSMDYYFWFLSLLHISLFLLSRDIIQFWQKLFPLSDKFGLYIQCAISLVSVSHSFPGFLLSYLIIT
jgi:hypothetical protein